jgi:hypothetical protein
MSYREALIPLHEELVSETNRAQALRTEAQEIQREARQTYRLGVRNMKKFLVDLRFGTPTFTTHAISADGSDSKFTTHAASADGSDVSGTQTVSVALYATDIEQATLLARKIELIAVVAAE